MHVYFTRFNNNVEEGRLRYTWILMIVIIKCPKEYWNGHQKTHNHWNCLTELTRLGLHGETLAQPGDWPYHRKGVTRSLVSCKLFATFCKEMHKNLARRGWLGLARDTFVRDKFSPYKGASYKFYSRPPCSQTSEAFCLLFCEISRNIE